MAITIQLTDLEELHLKNAMKLTGHSTKTKTIRYLIENAESLLKSDNAMRQIRELEEDITYKQKMIVKLKAGNAVLLSK